MRILDRQRYGDFAKAYVICFAALVGLCVVIDAFTNLDEFSEVASGSALLRNMGRYYLVRMSMFYDMLCGVIAMMAAIFAVTWMQRHNEMLAMLGAGVGTRRIIRPVLVSAVIVNVGAVANQEWLMPRLADELQRPPDRDPADTRVVKIQFHSRTDGREIDLLGGEEGDRAARTIRRFSATLPIALIGTAGGLDAREARYVPPDDPAAPLKGGWLLRGARLTPPDAAIDPAWLARLTPDQLEEFPPTAEGMTSLGDESFFLASDVSFDALARDNKRWFKFASTPTVMAALSDPINRPERTDIAVFLHARVLRPLLGLALLGVALPLVLSGMNRNMFVSLGLSLLTSGAFYGVCYVFRYLGDNEVLSPELAAWVPLIAFGTLAVARWDAIRS